MQVKMDRKCLFLILIMVPVIIMAFTSSVFAQEIDVDSMDNEQLTVLLLQILNKLQQEGDPEAVTPETPAEATAVPAADPEAIEEVIQITVYDNKKLIIEALPGYMFIRPTKEPRITVQDDEEPNEKPDTGGSEPGPVPGTPCDPNFPNFCFWTEQDGGVVCVCSELG